MYLCHTWEESRPFCAIRYSSLRQHPRILKLIDGRNKMRSFAAAMGIPGASLNYTEATNKNLTRPRKILQGDGSAKRPWISTPRQS